MNGMGSQIDGALRALAIIVVALLVGAFALGAWLF